MGDILFIRHGQSKWNHLFKLHSQGQDVSAEMLELRKTPDKNVKLTNEGVMQLIRTRHNAHNFPKLQKILNETEFVITSEFDRAIDSYKLLFGVPLADPYAPQFPTHLKDPRLNERFYGPYEGVPTSVIKKNNPLTHAIWNMIPYYFPAFGFESIHNVRQRVKPCLDEILTVANQGITLTIVYHQVVHRAVYSELSGVNKASEFLENQYKWSLPEGGFFIYNTDTGIDDEGGIFKEIHKSRK